MTAVARDPSARRLQDGSWLRHLCAEHGVVACVACDDQPAAAAIGVIPVLLARTETVVAQMHIGVELRKRIAGIRVRARRCDFTQDRELLDIARTAIGTGDVHTFPPPSGGWAARPSRF